MAQSLLDDDILISLGLPEQGGTRTVAGVTGRSGKSAFFSRLREHGILAIGLKFPVVPRGDKSARFQVSADHTPVGIDSALAVLESIARRGRRTVGPTGEGLSHASAGTHRSALSS